MPHWPNFSAFPVPDSNTHAITMIRRRLLLLPLFCGVTHANWAQTTIDSLLGTDPPVQQAPATDSTERSELAPLADTTEAVLLPDSLLSRSTDVTDTAGVSAKDTTGLTVNDSLGLPVTDTVGEVVSGTTGDVNKKVLRGTVYESDGSTPLIGALVSWSVNKAGVQTDLDGHFELPYHEQDTLRVTSVGFSDMVIPVQPGMNDLKITLKAATKVIEEVVITALGIERDTRTLSYDIQQLEGSKLTEVKDPNGNAMNNLAGKVAGLTITPAAGGLGSATRVALRGNRSIRTPNDALMIVDGVPVNNNFGSQPSDENGGYAGGDGAQNINPEDIESMSVLKGQSAAALYGGSAQNGAIMINTKRGRQGPLEINYSGGLSYQVPQLLIRYQNQYGRGNNGIYGPNSGFSWGEKATTYKDNVKDFFNTTTMLTNSINFSGGSEEVQAYASYSNTLGNGIVGNNKLVNHTFNVRLTGRFKEKLSTDFKLTYVSQDVDDRPKSGELGTALFAYIMPRDMSPSELNHYEDFDDKNQPYPAPWPTAQTSIYTNPYWYVNRTSYDTRRNRAIFLGKVNYEIMPWLNIQARYSLDFINDNTTGQFYDKTVLIADPGGRYHENLAQRYYSYLDLLLNGQNDFGDFSLTYTLGGSFDNVATKSVISTATGLKLPNLFILQNAITPVITGSSAQRQKQGLFATAQVGYKNFLFLDGTIRNDWSSTLPKPHSYLYPSVGLTAILSDIIDLPSWINFAKVRGTYAYVGQDAESFVMYQYYSYGPGTGGGFITRDGTKAIADLKPEQTRAFELGTDWKFFDQRLGLGLSVYQTNTYNQLVPLPLAPATGFANRWVNMGDIQNRGVEVFLTGVPIRKTDFSWTSTFIFSKNVNRVNRLSDDLKETKLSGSERLGLIGVREGDAYGDIYGTAWKRNDQGQLMVGANGLPLIEKDKKLGNVNADFLLGWSNEFRYKHLSLSFQLDGRVGGQTISGTDAYLASYGLADYTTAFREGGLVLDGVYEDGSKNTTDIKAEEFWSTVSQGGRAAWTEFFLYDATNFRLRQLSLGYTFYVDKPYLKAATVSLVANNLFFLYRGNAVLKISGMPERKIPTDPEASLGAGNVQGLESGMPPMSRGIGLNVRLTF